MNKLLLLCLILSTFVSCFSQNSRQADTNILIGKRKNIIWDRKITGKNIGNMFYNSYYPIYFKPSIKTQWQKIGLLGQNIQPYLSDNDSSYKLFRKYRQNKGISYASLPVTSACLLIWAYSAGAYNLRNNIGKDPIYIFGSYLRPYSLVFLGSYFVSYYLGMRFNARGDIYLKKSVDYRNSLYKYRKEHAYIESHISPFSMIVNVKF